MRNKTKIYLAIFAVVLSAPLFASAQNVVSKRLAGVQDTRWWDGTASRIFIQTTAHGNIITLTKVGGRVDALGAYVGDITYTDAIISSALSNIGATKKVKIVLSPGTWVFSSNRDWSAYTNVTWEILPGAVISHGAYNLTFGSHFRASPSCFSGTGTRTFSGTFEAGLSQVFTGGGMVTGLRYSVPEWWGAKDDSGATDNTTAFNSALANGGTVAIKAPSGGYYKITDAVTASVAGTTIKSDNHAEIRQTTSNKTGIAVTASNMTVQGLKITGPQYAAFKATEHGIHAYGADARHYLSGLKVLDCEVSSWGAAGILLDFVEGFDISGNKVGNCFYSGINGLSAQDGRIKGNIVDSIIGDGTVGGGALGGVYGIAVSKHNGDLVTYPTAKRILISDNLVKSVTVWEGYDTHAGQEIHFINNVSYDNMYGIMVTRYSSGGLDIGPKNCVIRGNTVVNENIATTTVRGGIFLVGASADYGSNNVVSNNTIRGHGKSDAAITSETGAAIYVSAQDNAIISNNMLYNSGREGIRFDIIGANIRVTGNTIKNLTGTGEAFYLRGYGGAATGIIGQNTIDVSGSTAFYFYDTVSMDLVNNKIIAAAISYNRLPSNMQ